MSSSLHRLLTTCSRIALLGTALLLSVACQPASHSETGTLETGNERAQARLVRWQQLGYGMFIHWGLYSELGGVWQGQPIKEGYSEQIQGWAGISAGDYAKVAARFDAKDFDADAICQLARDAGARYIVVTSKHHDGFVMFATKTTDYNIVQATPFARDPLKLLVEACRKRDIGFGVYFSLVDWHAGHTPEVQQNSNPIPPAMEPLIEQQLTELMTNYGPIVEVWFDMGAPTPAQSRRFVDIVRQHQPDAAINGRIWNNAGDFITLGDNQLPPANMLPPFQVPASIYHATWGYRSWQVRDDRDGKVRELVNGLVQARAAGGNSLINIGPDGSGAVVPFEAEVMTAIGDWLRRHQHAPLTARPAALPPQTWGSVMADDDGLLLFVRDWQGGELTVSGLASVPRAVQIDGAEGAVLAWQRRGDDLVIELPETAPDPVLSVLRVTLDTAPNVILPDSIALSASGDAELPLEIWQPRIRFVFAEGYFTQQESTVALHAALRSKRVHPALWLRFHDVNAASGKYYRVRMDGQEYSVDAASLAGDAIGPFVLGEGESEGNFGAQLSIELAAPKYPAQTLDLYFSGVTVFAR